MSMTEGSSQESSGRPTVFIHTNHRQMIGALVSQYSMKRNSAQPDAFDVHLIKHGDYDFFDAYEGRDIFGTARVAYGETTTFSPLLRFGSCLPNSWGTKATRS